MPATHETFLFLTRRDVLTVIYDRDGEFFSFLSWLFRDNIHELCTHVHFKPKFTDSENPEVSWFWYLERLGWVNLEKIFQDFYFNSDTEIRLRGYFFEQKNFHFSLSKSLNKFKLFLRLL